MYHLIISQHTTPKKGCQRYYVNEDKLLQILGKEHTPCNAVRAFETELEVNWF